MKSPEATAYLPVVLEVFPDARLIWPHRDPIKAMASAVNMIGNFVWARSDTIPPASVFDFMTDPEASARRLSTPIDLIENGTIPSDQIASIRYDELVDDPLAALEKTYAQIGIDLSQAAREAIADHFARNPQEARKPHRYQTGDADRIAREREHFRRYQDYFSIPSEV
ncbi:hypothetical protein GCM10011371_13320 [Novosphingobium marinum]|uniref:Sulfotransferase n=1 Tax=Novosphingobium marinum TaxID=1514948 RepID=A0A7Y9XVV6_9SPHN|nr:hypothetical protein [Novosphingobium marinum]GGC27093.1 hypothetical protein GCM10011371_13320 [Novosphingobium marinum]